MRANGRDEGLFASYPSPVHLGMERSKVPWALTIDRVCLSFHQTKERISYARICIEIEAQDELPGIVEVGCEGDTVEVGVES